VISMYLWEPNRHLHLVTLAQAYHQSGEQRYLDGYGTSLNPGSTSAVPAGAELDQFRWNFAIRLINWSIAWQLIGGLVPLCLPGRCAQFPRALVSVDLSAYAFHRGHSRATLSQQSSHRRIVRLYVGV